MIYKGYADSLAAAKLWEMTMEYNSIRNANIVSNTDLHKPLWGKLQKKRIFVM